MGIEIEKEAKRHNDNMLVGRYCSNLVTYYSTSLS